MLLLQTRMAQVLKMARYTAVAGMLALGTMAQAQTIQEGLKYQDLEQSAKALNTFQQLVQKTPTAENYYYLGAAQLRYDNAAGAKTSFDAGIAKDPNFALNYVGLGSLALKTGNKAEANAQFAKAATLGKNKNAEVHYQIGKAWLAHDTKDGVEAITNLTKATQLNAKVADYWLALGDAYMFMGEGGRAADMYEQKALPLNPNYAKTYIKRGIIMERARNYTEALRLYKEGIDKEPGYWPAYRELGELYKRANRTREGFTYYEKFIQNSDRTPQDLNQYADFLLTLGEYEKCLAVLKELDGKVKNPFIYRGFGYCQLETKAYAEGLDNMKKFFAQTEAKAQNAKDYRVLAMLSLNTAKSATDTAGALGMLKAAYAKDTNEVKDMRTLLKSFVDAKTYAPAITIGSFLDSVGRADASDYLNYGRSLHQTKMFVEADSAFARLNRMSPTFAYGWYWRAYNASRIDNKTETWLAQPYYEQFVTLNPEKEKFAGLLKPSLSYLISYYLIKERNKDKTTEFANKLLELDPNAQNAKDALKHDFSKPLPKAAPAAPAKPAAKPAPKK